MAHESWYLLTRNCDDLTITFYRGKIYLKIGRDVVPNVVGVLHQTRIYID